MFHSFLFCWLSWCWYSFCFSSFLLFVNVFCYELVLELWTFFEVCWSCPFFVECCLSLCCPVIFHCMSSCSIYRSDEGSSLLCKSCDVWSIVCLLRYVQIHSWLNMYSFPHVAFSNPIVRRWLNVFWMWNRCCWCGCLLMLLRCVFSWPLVGVSCQRLLCWRCWCRRCFWYLECLWWYCWWLWWSVAWEDGSFLYSEPCFSSPCWSLQDSFLLWLVEFLVLVFKVFVVAILSVDNGSSVVLKSVCWYWTSAIWYEECFTCCPVCSDQKSLCVECPCVVSVSDNLHSCWCDGHWCNCCWSCCSCHADV